MSLLSFKGWKKRRSVNKHGFTFNQYGVRVPALVVSPWVPRNTVDGTLYDHSTVPATLRALQNQLPVLTHRDANANHVLPLLSLAAPRKDTPSALPGPNGRAAQIVSSPAPAGADQALDHGSIPGFAYLALRDHLDGVTSKQQRQEIRLRYKGLQTHHDLHEYFKLARTARAGHLDKPK